MQYTPGRTAGLLREFGLSPLCLGHWQRNRSDCWVLRVSDCKAFVAVISGITDRTTVYRDGTNTYDSTISTLPGFVGPVDNAYVPCSLLLTVRFHM